MIRRAFAVSPKSPSFLVDDLDIADLVIIFQRLPNPEFPAEMLFERNVLRHYRKTIIFSTDDTPTITHHEMYAGMSCGQCAGGSVSGGFYPHVANQSELEQCI